MERMKESVPVKSQSYQVVSCNKKEKGDNLKGLFANF